MPNFKLSEIEKRLRPLKYDCKLNCKQHGHKANYNRKFPIIIIY